MLAVLRNGIVRISEFPFPVRVFAVGPVLTVTIVRQILTLNRLVVAVGLGLVVGARFLNHFVVLYRQGLVGVPEFLGSVRKMALRASITPFEKLEGSAFLCFVF